MVNDRNVGIKANNQGNQEIVQNKREVGREGGRVSIHV